MKSNKVEVYFELSGFEDLTHAQISQQLGLKPSKVYVKGQPVNPKAGRLAPSNRWLLFGYDPAGPWPVFEDQVDALQALMLPRLAALQALCHRYTCEVKAAVLIYSGNGESTPAVHLERRHVEWLKVLRAEFDVDIYCHEG